MHDVNLTLGTHARHSLHGLNLYKTPSLNGISISVQHCQGPIVPTLLGKDKRLIKEKGKDLLVVDGPSQHLIGDRVV
jgi:hypothetical protein